MKIALLAAGAGALVTVATLAAQNPQPGPGGPRSPFVAALDSNHDGIVSAAEIQASASALKSLDRNGDGQLTVDEVRPPFGPGGRRGRGEEGARGGGEPGGAPGDLADTLMSFDRNGDGKLVRTEVPERFQGLFTRVDADKDGALTKEELKQGENAAAARGEGGRRGGDGRGEFGGRGRGGAFDPLLRALDRDRDGAVSAAEIDSAPDALRSLDANQDGQLSNDEFRPPFGRGRGDRR